MRRIAVGFYVVGAVILFTASGYGDGLLVSGGAASNGLNVIISAPNGFTNRVEVYRCFDLTSNNWRIATQNLRPTEDTPAQWYVETTNDTGFFIAGNMDIDRDGDGIPDALAPSNGGAGDFTARWKPPDTPMD